MEIKDIEYVKAIVKYKSITKAAEALYISQPSLSVYIKNMQERLGFEVFEQEGKKLSLTYLGEEFLSFGNQILKVREDFFDAVQNIQKNQFGRLKLAIPLLRSSYLVPELLPKFYQLYPNVEVVLKETSSAKFPKLIKNGDVDLALMNRHHDDKYLTTEKIKSEEMVIALPSNHHLKSLYQTNKTQNCQYPSIKLDMLKDELFILHQPDQFSRQMAEDIFQQNHFHPKSILATRNIETATNLVANQMGVSFVNSSHTKHLNSNDKVILFSLEKKVTVDLIVAYRKGRKLPSYANDFIEICKNNI